MFNFALKEKVKLEKHSIRGVEENERAGYRAYLAQIEMRVGLEEGSC